MPNQPNAFDDYLRAELATELNQLSFVASAKQRMTQSVASTSKSPSRLKGIIATVLTTSVIAGGGLAYATGNHDHALAFIGNIFAGAPADTEIVKKIGRPIDAADSDNAVTIKAESIIGDGTNYAVVYSISKDDGTKFEGLPAPQFGLLPLGFGHSGTYIQGSQGGGGSSYFYDADPSDPAIQYVEQLSITSDTELFGKTARVKFKDLGVYDTKVRPLAKGTWKLKFEFAYEDASRTVVDSGSFNVPAGTAHIASLKVSPIAISVKYHVDQPVPDTADPEHHPASKFDDIGVFILTMRDGSTMTVPAVGSTLMSAGNGTDVNVNAFLPEIIDPDEVVSVHVGGAEFPAPLK